MEFNEATTLFLKKVLIFRKRGKYTLKRKSKFVLYVRIHDNIVAFFKQSEGNDHEQ